MNGDNIVRSMDSFANKKISMHLRLTLKYVVAFLALMFVLQEGHELVHTSVGRLICGCWGQRDFNVWATCDSCANPNLGWLATLVGPLFTFAVVWAGYFLMAPGKSLRQHALGFTLVFAPMPFARLINPVMGGGDEVVVVNNLVQQKGISRVIVFVLVLLILALPLIRAFRMIKNRYRIGWFCLFFFGAMLLDYLILFQGMNRLLKNGVMAQYWILGSPLLITVWTAAMLLLFLMVRRGVFDLVKPTAAESR